MANEKLSLEHLIEAARPGGPSVLTEVTELAPAAGEHASVAPARYTPSKAPRPTSTKTVSSTASAS